MMACQTATAGERYKAVDVNTPRDGASVSAAKRHASAEMKSAEVDELLPPRRRRSAAAVVAVRVLVVVDALPCQWSRQQRPARFFFWVVKTVDLVAPAAPEVVVVEMEEEAKA